MNTIKNNLAVFQTGNKNNQPIVFIHGFPFDHKMWDFQVDYFKKDYHCITYDISGLGESPAGDGQYTMEGFVDDLFNVVESLKLNKPVLCGLSMGGYIALRAIERNEEKIKALILCDTKSEADSNAGKINRAKGVKEINEIGAEKFAEGFVQRCFSEEFVKTNREEYEQVVMRSKESDPVGLKGCLLAMAGRTDTTGYLDKIKIPVLVLCGEEDQLTPPSVMKSMSDKIAGSLFHTIPKSGHVTPVENPKVFNSIVEKFLKNI